jgi:hypothetical protein
LPGARFSARDQERLSTWLSNTAQGLDKDANTRFAFGLTNQQLRAVRQALSRRTIRNTKGADTTDILDELIRTVELPVQIAPAARARLQEAFPVGDELRGLSHGATFAALLRPVGLVMYPTDAGQKLMIDSGKLAADAPAADAPESWPIGWPLEGKPHDVAPELYRKLEISFDNVELDRALDALRQRMKVPVVLDRQGLARQQIDLSTIRVSLPKARTYYKRALEVAVRQAKLRAELRIDEAGSPFFWVAPRTTREGD